LSIHALTEFINKLKRIDGEIYYGSSDDSDESTFEVTKMILVTPNTKVKVQTTFKVWYCRSLTMAPMKTTTTDLTQS
jgi:hypothetical protein